MRFFGVLKDKKRQKKDKKSVVLLQHCDRNIQHCGRNVAESQNRHN